MNDLLSLHKVKLERPLQPTSEKFYAAEDMTSIDSTAPIAAAFYDNVKTADHPGLVDDFDSERNKMKACTLATAEAGSLEIRFLKIFGSPTPDNVKMLVQIWEKNSDTIIGEISLCETGTDCFELEHRLIMPTHRGKGYSIIIFRAAESFLQGISDLRQRPQRLTIELSQLDVLAWAYNGGFRPENPVDRDRVNKILDGDDKLSIGENLYIFEGEVKPIETFQEKKTDTYRVTLVKEIAPKNNPSISETQNRVKNLLARLYPNLSSSA